MAIEVLSRSIYDILMFTAPAGSLISPTPKLFLFSWISYSERNPA